MVLLFTIWSYILLQNVVTYITCMKHKYGQFTIWKYVSINKIDWLLTEIKLNIHSELEYKYAKFAYTNTILYLEKKAKRSAIFIKYNSTIKYDEKVLFFFPLF